MIKNVHGNTLDYLGLAIMAGKYPPGSALPPEPALGASLGVSRTVVRETVKSLVAKGLVSTGPKVGTRVLPEEDWNWFDHEVIGWHTQSGLTQEFVRDLQELRMVVEPMAVRLAAERATAADVAEIRDAYEGMVRANREDSPDYIAHDMRFHLGVLRACHNRLLAHMGRALGALLRTSFELSTAKKGSKTKSLRLHGDIVDAIAARDPGKGEKAILQLITDARKDIESVLFPRSKPPARKRPSSTRKR